MEPRPNDTPTPLGPRDVPPQGPTVGESVFPGPSLLQVVWQGRWVVLGVTVLCLVAGFYYLATATPIYESTSRVYVEKEGPMVISRDEGGLMTQSRNFLYTQAELFKSMNVLDTALKSLDPRNMKTFAGVDNDLIFLRKSVLDVSVGKKDEIISVSARSPYPVEAARIANAVVDAYCEDQRKLKRTTSRDLRDILEKKYETQKNELDKALDKIVTFREDADVLVFENERENLSMRRMDQLWQALSTAQLETLDARIAYETLKNTPGNPLAGQGLISPELQTYFYAAEQEYRRNRRQLRHDLSLAEETLAGLEAEFTPACPAVVAARTRIKRLQTEIQDLETNWTKETEKSYQTSLALAEQRYLTAQQKEEKLDQETRDFEKSAKKAMVKQAEFARLQSDKERAQNLSDILDSRIREINVTESTGALNINPFEYAKPGDKPVSPQKARIMAIALVLGLMLGVGLAFVRDLLNKRLRSSDEMAAVLSAPVLGVLPHMKETGDASLTGQRVHLKPSSVTAEAFRTVRTAIHFNALNRKDKPRTLLITSPTGGDGKSTVSSNLAIAMAQTGQRVLLIDADLRRSNQHRIFKVNGHDPATAPNLGHAVLGEVPVDALIQTTAVPNLDLLPCLSHVASPGEVLNSPEFAALLQDLRNRYDLVLIDSPPVMPVADARVLSAICDATVVVLRADKSTRKVTELTREGLDAVGARILGLVVNDVPKRKGGHGHYGYYGVSKYYRYDSYRYGDRRKNENGNRSRGERSSTGSRRRAGEGRRRDHEEYDTGTAAPPDRGPGTER